MILAQNEYFNHKLTQRRSWNISKYYLLAMYDIFTTTHYLLRSVKHYNTDMKRF